MSDILDKYDKVDNTDILDKYSDVKYPLEFAKKFKDDKYEKGIKLIVNGIEKDTVENSSIIDFGWFVKSVASREGIKNFTIKVNGEPIAHSDLPNVEVGNIKTLELSTFDVARHCCSQ